MAVNHVGGNKFVLNTEYLTAGENLADKTLVCWTGSAPASAAGLVMGVVQKDTPNAEQATVITDGLVEVFAAGAVTKGALVEALDMTIIANINGTSTSLTNSGVVDHTNGVSIGQAYTGSDAGGTVLVLIIKGEQT